MSEFFACEHPMHVKYVVSGRGIVCTKCDPTWYVNPLLERENPASTARFREAFDRVAALLAPLPMRAHVPLMSPRCGLHGEHTPACRSAICECVCHLTPLPMTDEDWAETEA